MKAQKRRKHVQQENIHWPNFWDQSPTGPIAHQWKVDGRPTAFIIAAKGIFRYRDVGRTNVEHAIKMVIERCDCD